MREKERGKRKEEKLQGRERGRGKEEKQKEREERKGLRKGDGKKR